MAEGGSSKPKSRSTASDEEGGCATEMASQPSETVLRKMLAASVDFVAHITTEGEMIYVNWVVPGLAEQDVLGTKIFDYLHPDHATAVRQALRDACLTGEPQERIVVGDGPHGEPRTYINKLSPIVEGGVVTSLVVNATDISALHDAQTALHEHEQILELAVGSTGLGIWTALPDDGGGTWDATTRRIFGYPEESTIPPTADAIFSRIHPDDLDEVRAAIGAAFENEEGRYVMEHRVRWPDGTIRWILGLGRVVRDEGTPPRIIGGVLDITERKLLEARLNEAERLESIGRLAGGIAHDFNNLLTTITTAAEFAAREVQGHERAGRLVADIRLAADRSADLIRQLLAVARRQIIEPRTLDPNDLVQRVESLMRRLLGENIRLVTTYAAEGVVRADPSQLEQVLLNLVANARDAMSDGGRLSISTSNAAIAEGSLLDLPAGDYVLISVEDDGAGIDPDALPHVFEPFFSVKERGTGLGLATSYGIVKQSGGDIGVDSVVGRGSRFDVYLPRRDGSPSSTSDPVQDDTAAVGETVLLAEDEGSVRRLLAHALKMAGYDVIIAADGVEALELAEGHDGPIDLLVSDVVMPRMGGVALAERLTASRPGLVVLFISGWTADAIASRHGELDGDLKLLQKPFTPMTLLAKMREVLAETERSRAARSAP